MTRLTHPQMLELKRWNAPTVYNGWEAVTRQDRARGWFNREGTCDDMPDMGPMVGRALTVVCETSKPERARANPRAWTEYREFMAGVPGPKILVVQDLDEPDVIGAFWGEVNSNVHRALGRVGTITDGAIRDLDEMPNAGFTVIARRMCVGHAYSCPVCWNCEVEVFGTTIFPGALIHADEHGFLVIPEEDEVRLLEATVFMDQNERNTVVPAARSSAAKPVSEILAALDEAGRLLTEAARQKLGQKGEW